MKTALVGIALLAGAVVAPSLSAADQEYWAGKWKTENRFNSPTLLLTQDGDHVEGRYKDRDEDGGRIRGTIAGDTRQNGTVLKGGYAQNKGLTSGSFKINLDSDGKTFKGHFTPYGSSDEYKWKGECVKGCTGL